MISQSPTAWIVACDRCAEGGAELHKQREDLPDWRDLIVRLKRLGWRIFKNTANAWEHWCPDCGGADDAGGADAARGTLL